MSKQNLRVDIEAGGRQVILSGSFIAPYGENPVIHIDPEDKQGEKFKVVFSFVDDEVSEASIKLAPLNDGSPHGATLILSNISKRSQAGRTSPFKIADNNTGNLYMSFIVFSSSGSIDKGHIVQYTFYKDSRGSADG